VTLQTETSLQSIDRSRKFWARSCWANLPFSARIMIERTLQFGSITSLPCILCTDCLARNCRSGHEPRSLLQKAEIERFSLFFSKSRDCEIRSLLQKEPWPFCPLLLTKVNNVANQSQLLSLSQTIIVPISDHLSSLKTNVVTYTLHIINRVIVHALRTQNNIQWKLYKYVEYVF
jgi:hypothetical protein